MSSWLSGGISSWTDQISTFTKEVIAESTQEIEDPVTELQLAKKRIDEVEKQNALNHEELKRFRNRVKELEDRSETAELQVVNNNHEYKKLLQERDDELKQIRKRYSELQEQQKKLLFSSEGDLTKMADPSATQLLVPSSNPSIGSMDRSSSEGIFQLGRGEEGEEGGEYGWLGDAPTDDLDYGFQSHSHVNQLQSEVARLQVECQHWKELARSKPQQDQDTAMSTDSNASSQIQHLQLCLEEERRHHQHEMSTLQALHSRQLEQALKERSDMPPADANRLTDANDELLMAKLQHSQALINELNGFLADIRKLLKYFQDSTQLEAEKTALLTYLSEIQDSFGMHQSKISDLHQQQLNLEGETEQLNRQVATLQLELKEKEDEINLIRNPEESTESVAMVNSIERQMIEDLEKQLKEWESEMNREREERLRLQGKMDVLEGKMTFAKKEIEEKNVQLNSSETCHKQELLKLNKEIKDLQEKLVLEESAFLEKEHQSEKVRSQELADSRTAMEASQVELKKQVDIVQSLETQLASISDENKELKLKLKETEQFLSSERETVKQTSVEHQEKVAQYTSSQLAMEQQVHCIQTELESLRVERDKLLQDLDSEQSKNSTLRSTMEAVKSEVEKKEREVPVLKEGNTNGRQEDDAIALSKLSEENRILTMEGEKNRKEIQRLRTHLSEINEQHDLEQIQANNRETQLMDRLKLIEQEKLNKPGHSDSVVELRKELEQVRLERTSLIEEYRTLKETHSRDLLALNNLQAVLEDFQQGRNESREASISLITAQREIEQLRGKCGEMEREKSHLEVMLEKASAANNEAHSLKVLLDKSQGEIKRLADELSCYKAVLEKSRATIEQMSIDAVDKTLVRKMFVTYLSSRDKKKDEIARLIGKVLDVPPQELNQLISTGSGWFSHFFAPPAQDSNQESLSQRFVSFLESESIRTPPMSHPILEAPPTNIPSSRSSIPAHMQPAASFRQSDNDSSTIIGQLLDKNETI